VIDAGFWLERRWVVTSLVVVAKVWVLDTATKGTGAHVVPLEKVLKQPSATPERRRARPIPKPAPKEKPAEPAPPRRFRVIDSLSRELLADDVDAAETLDLLHGIEKPVDVSVYVWEPRAETWRLLTRRERSLLWDVRNRRRSRQAPAEQGG
jgi:hypothetical protein